MRPRPATATPFTITAQDAGPKFAPSSRSFEDVNWGRLYIIRGGAHLSLLLRARKNNLGKMASTPQTLVGSAGGTTGSATPADTTGTTSHHHHHLHHSGKRLRQFLRPDGGKVHIVGSPDEAEQLRQTLSRTEKEGDFDLVIHGSPEHVR